MDRYAADLEREAERLLALDGPTNQHPVTRDLDLLEAICEELPTASLLAAARVSRLFHVAATNVLLRDVVLESSGSTEQFKRLLGQKPDVGKRVKGFQLTRACVDLLPSLPQWTPNLAKLTIGSSARISEDDLVRFLPAFPSLRHLVIVGQDSRSRRRRRLSETEPESDAGKALRTLADQGGAGVYLLSLSILNTPLKLSTLDHFLEASGGGLTALKLDGCGIGAGLTQLVERWCPKLRECHLDSLSSAYLPPSTPREDDFSLEFDRAIPLCLPPHLTTLHLSSLPTLEPSAFALFSLPHYAALNAVSFSHCDISVAHLSFFSRVRKLKVVACPNVNQIPVFPVSGSKGFAHGPGCQELRQISLLGCRGLTLGNLWELAMLGRDVDLSLEEQQERSRLGLGTRGLRKITLDAADGRELLYTVQGVHFTMPWGFGSRPEPTTVRSRLPPSLLPPPHLFPFLDVNVLDPNLPSNALLQTLIMAQDLEEVALFGIISSAPTTPSTPSRWTRTATRLMSFVTSVPVISSLADYIFPAPPEPGWPPAALRHLAAMDKFGSKPWPSATASCRGKRLSDADVAWLLQGPGPLRRVYV